MTVILKIVIVYFLFLVLLLFIQNRLIFHPTKEYCAVPRDLGLKGEDVSFTTSDGMKLHGWFFHVDRDAPVMLFCHGNAGNISDRLENVKLLLEIPVNVFIFDYRGYGKSPGKPSEEGVYRDAEAAWQYIRKQRGTPAERIVFFGRSLGGAIALDVAIRHPVRAIILESTFVSLRSLVKKMFPYLLFYPFIPSKFANDRKIEKIHIPILIIHGSDDHTVPWRQGKMLYELANQPKEFWLVKGAQHTDSYEVSPLEYKRKLGNFMKNVGLF